MNKLFAILTFLSFSFYGLAKEAPKENGFNISIQLNCKPGQKYYLGYYFGDKQYLRDSSFSDKTGKIQFKGKGPLEGGVYMLASADKTLLFDFVVTEQVFSLETDTSDMVNHMKVKGSAENDIFFNYTRFTNKMGREAMKLEAQMKEAQEKKDSSKINALNSSYTKITESLDAFRDTLIQNHPSSLLAKIFRIMNDINVPPAPKDENGNIIDSNFQYNYYKAHFFDNFDWADERIVRTPVFHQKIESYMTKLTPQLPDSICHSADILLKQAEAGKENFKYCLYWITNHYETSTYMGMDKVFVYMVDNYYKKGKAFWLDETLLFKMKDRADQLRNNLIGNKAPNLTMLDTNNVYHSLYNIKSKYTLLIFWDANCGKCKEEMPKLVTLYDELNKNKKEQYFDVFGVSLTPDSKDWLKYLREKHLKWLNVYDPNNETNFRRLYDIYSTPVLFLLDANKTIIAKRIGVEQLKTFIADFEAGKVKF